MYGPFDKELELRDIAAGPVTVSTAEPGKNIPVTDAGDFKVVTNVSAIDTAGADEDYVLSVEVANDAAFTTPVNVGDVNLTPLGVGVFEVPLSGEQIRQRVADASHIRVNMTIVGGVGGASITYGAWISPAA